MERYPSLKEKVGGLIPGCGISSLLDRFLVMGIGHLSQEIKIKKIKNRGCILKSCCCERGIF